MSNLSYNPAYYRERRQPGQLAAYLLGMGPMPPPTQQEIAVAAANYMLDNPAGPPGPPFHRDNNEFEDQNIDPQLRPQQAGPALSQTSSQSQSKHNHIFWVPLICSN